MNRPAESMSVPKWRYTSSSIVLVDQGVCIVIISSEHQEVLGICDRILVMGGGEIRAELDWKDATQEKILSYSIGESGE